jgi:beta-aspartyl-peptidase (threonine type)
VPGIVVASANGNVGIGASIDVLQAGGSAVDAVVAGIKLVEANPLDHSVGFSGLPNLLGEVELDASVMDGTGLRAGSVGALHGFQDAVTLARTIMDTMPHVLIVGAGADRLAAETGLSPIDLLTDEAVTIWKQRFAEMGSSAPGAQDAYYSRIHEIVGQTASDPQKVGLDIEDVHGTVNFIAQDATGAIACGVSTSGWAWKYPGRLGDSPIIGAGNYADNRFGAAACTGRGEMAQRCLTAHSVVTFMRFGMSISSALEQAMLDLRELDDPFRSEMNIIGLDKDGTPAAASSAADKTYIYQRTDMDSYVEEPRAFVPYE